MSSNSTNYFLQIKNKEAIKYSGMFYVISLVSVFSVLVSPFLPILIIIPVIGLFYLVLLKSGRRRIYVAQCFYHLKRGNIVKSLHWLEKARKIKNDKMLEDLTEEINALNKKA